MELNVLANIYFEPDQPEMSEEDALNQLHEILENALDDTGVSYQIHKVISD